ncbi:MAG: 30S ribosomal protein S6 [Candidatus Amesbacteria bacterium GW2011_GWA2_42_12]|uniref:Small ribosomal subunit protein bS6 n=1 Tax=Candidatus Amesbacteria bacterium GW2011_GWA2_42_12 TaxID=1618356 RepID=A0A0G0Y8W6_9BACT|nr:MAG: 30S ribosomal protein S6 [Candidatus Amesbacteria bacterium GW2011_GWA2_42_12]
MNKYDLTMLVKSTEGVEDKMEKLVKALNGKAGRMVEMGKKQLAYPIKKLSEAHYLTWTLELESPSVVQLERKLTVDRDVIRHLLVRNK